MVHTRLHRPGLNPRSTLPLYLLWLDPGSRQAFSNRVTGMFVKGLLTRCKLIQDSVVPWKLLAPLAWSGEGREQSTPGEEDSDIFQMDTQPAWSSLAEREPGE